MIPHFPRFHGYVHVRHLHGNGYAARSRDREYVDVSFGVESDGGIAAVQSRSRFKR